MSLEAFYVDETQSTYTETQEDGRRSFIYNLNVAEAFKQADCIGPKGKAYIRAVLPVLLRYVQRRNLTKYAFALENYDAYKDMVTKNGAIFKAIFNDMDLNDLKRTNLDDYHSLMQYLVNCAGVREPVFVFILANNGSREIIVTSIEYIVSNVGITKGGDAKLLEPLATENHSIPHRSGTYRRNLTNPLRLPPTQSARIDVRLFSQDPGVGLFWDMAIKIQGTDGQTVTTSPFRLTMSK